MPQFLGELDFAGDSAVFLLDLQRGVQYYFELEGLATQAGTLVDPLLQLRRDFFLIADDDGGVGFNARIVFTPSATGTYELVVRGSDDAFAGSFRLGAFEDEARNSFEGAGAAPLIDTVGLTSTMGTIGYDGDVDLYRTTLIEGLRYDFQAGNRCRHRAAAPGAARRGGQSPR